MNNLNEILKARDILGITESSTVEDVKKRYNKLAKKWHPDLNMPDESRKKIQEINGAYELIMKTEFNIMDPWEDYNKWWWKQYGNDPIWGNYIDKKESNENISLINHNTGSPQKQKTKNTIDECLNKNI